MPATVTVTDALVLYAIPLALATGLWLAVSAWVWLLTRVSSGSALRVDLERRVAARGRTRSGKGARLSFGYVAGSLLADNSVQATVLYRVSRWLTIRRLRALSTGVHAISKLVTHADLSPRATIGPGFYLYHGLGTVIGKGTIIGQNALVCQNVTTGGGPTIGDDVVLWAGAKVIGRITIGDRSEIGANGVVVSDVPPDSVAVGVPARCHPRPLAPPAEVLD